MHYMFYLLLLLALGVILMQINRSAVKRGASSIASFLLYLYFVCTWW